MNTHVIKREGTHTISVSSMGPMGLDISITDCGNFIALERNIGRLNILKRDIPELIKALQPFANEVNEEKSI